MTVATETRPSRRAPMFGAPQARAKRLADQVVRKAQQNVLADPRRRGTNATYRAFQERYFNDPAGFVRDCVKWADGQGPTAYQLECIDKLTTSTRVSVRGPHGLGKSFSAAMVVLWFSLTRDGRDWKAVTTASVWRQLTKYLWPEIHKWSRRLDWQKIGREPFNETHELLMLSLKLRTGEAFAVASDQPSAIEGAHADHMLYLFDEAKAIVAPTWDAAEGAFSAAGTDTPQEALAFAISTPGDIAGRFHEIHTHAAGYEDWWTRHVTLDEAIAAGRISREWADQRAAQWGKDSALYQNRVEGEFAAGDDGGIIPLGWVEAAQRRWRALRDGGELDDMAVEVAGVDVSDGGGDRTFLGLRGGDVLIRMVDVTPKAHGETMAIAGRVKGLADGAEEKGGSLTAVVDSIGVGAGVVSRLVEQSVNVVAFNASEATKQRDASGSFGFLNKRAAAYWNLREMLDPEGDFEVALPDDPLLTAELTVPKYRIGSGGRMQLQAKAEIKVKLNRSPDRADAVVMAFWVASGGGGSAGSLPWATRKAETTDAPAPTTDADRAPAKPKRRASMGALPWSGRDR